MKKVIDIGNTQAKVRITHARKSPLYFIKTFFREVKLLPCQEELIRRLKK